jgi:hypothetical protein
MYEGAMHTYLSGRYQTSMLRALKEVRADDSVIGFYQSTTMGAFFGQSLVDTQAIHQEKLRHGGVVVVHGTCFLFYPHRHKNRQLFLLHQIYLNLTEEMPLFVHSDFPKTSFGLTGKLPSVPSRELSFVLFPVLRSRPNVPMPTA